MSTSPGTLAAIEFLETYAPTGPWHLTAFAPNEGGMSGEHFGPHNRENCVRWIEERNGRHNLYFHVNVSQTAGVKARKGDMTQARYLHVDIDPEEGADLPAERERILHRLTSALPEGLPRPTFVVDSGNGFWAFWRLLPAMELISLDVVAQVEACNVGLGALLGADSAHNVDRLARLPGTMNIPNAKKLKLNRTASWSKVVEHNVVEYDFSEFAPFCRVKASTHQGAVHLADPTRLSAIDDLDRWKVADRIKVICLQGRHPSEQGKPGDDSRSGWLFDATCSLVRHEVPPEVIIGILTDPRFAISESVLEKGNMAEKYARRQVERATDFVADPDLEELNGKYAVVTIGGKTRVAQFETDTKGRERVEVFLTFEDFRNQTMNRVKEVAGRPVRLGQWWLSHSKRRQYGKVVFDPSALAQPGVLNLWTGFAVDPAPGDWSLIREHVLSVLAAGNANHADYIIKWMAWTCQNPDRRAEVALVFLGKKGSGKGTFGNLFVELFHPHSRAISQGKHLAGNFNAHLRDCCLLFADEAYWPGDRSAEGTLKSLVSEPNIMIEAKGLDAVMMPNRLHIIMASNEDWAVPASSDERRYAVFRVSNHRVGDHDYFNAIDAQVKAGAMAAMLHDLISMDLGAWKPRIDIPETEALNQQREASLSKLERAVLDCLMSGELPPFCTIRATGEAFIPTHEFGDWLRRRDMYVTDTAVGEFLGVARSGRRASLHFTKVDSGRPRGYLAPQLTEARQRWDEAMFPQEWPDDHGWATAHSGTGGSPF